MSNTGRGFLLCSFLAFAVILLVVHRAAGVGLADFGYATMIVDREPPLGPYPLLVVLFDIEGGIDYDAAHSVTYFSNLVFSLASPRSMVGYHLENSNGRFLWTRAGPGIVGPIPLGASEGYFPTEQRAGGVTPLTDLLYYSNLVARTMMSGKLNLAQFDLNGDTRITADELHLLFVVNEPSPATTMSIGARSPGEVRPPEFAYSVAIGRAAGIQFITAFDSALHELTHTLGAIDLYYGAGGLSDHLTLMGGTSSTADDRQIFHLDPWHKLRLGWCEPRIRSMRNGGVETIPAAQMLDPTAPIILYDPIVGPGQYFILEYRTRTSPNGPGYDTEAAGNGLVVWRVAQDANRNPTIGPHVDAGLDSGQGFWRRCQKCQGLYWIKDDRNPVLVPCPAGGQHSSEGSRPYLVVNAQPAAPGQHGWRWCNKCHGLFFGPGEAESRCPATGAHNSQGSGDYTVVQNTSEAPGEQDWRWCRKCQSIFFGPNESLSDCAADHGRHDGSQSGNYSMLVAVWDGGGTTSYLRWANGAPTSTRLHVRPFSPGAGSITVEWWTEDETWVNFNSLGLPNFAEDGTQMFPFNSVAEAVSAASHGGKIRIWSGATRETPTIHSKRVMLDAVNGPVTIGRQP